MNSTKVIRAWRDPVYRSELGQELLSELPQHPIDDGMEDVGDWSARLGALSLEGPCAITLGGGCGSFGCTQIICTDPCGTLGDSCPRTTETRKCSEAGLCEKPL